MSRFVHAAVLTLVAASAHAQGPKIVNSSPTEPVPNALAPAPAPQATPATLPVSVASTAIPLPPPPAKDSPPAEKSALSENLRKLTPGEVKLSWKDRHWQLTHNGEVLKDFGTREQDARQALRLFQELQLNQYATIGSPPVMEYWLHDGAAPRTQVNMGIRSLPLDANHLRVEQSQGKWILRDAQRVLFSFATRGDADQALGVIKTHHFDEVGVVGGASPMYIFTSRGSGTGTNPTSIRPTPFPRMAKNGDGSVKRASGTTTSPLAGVPLPTFAAVNHTETAHANGPLQQTLTDKQKPLWRSQPMHSVKAQLPPAGRVPLDWRQVQLKYDGGEWALVAGSQLIANFGSNGQDARSALAAIRYYRFTEQHRLGGAEHGVSYCAATGASPRGMMMGLQGKPIAAEELKVQQIGKEYALTKGDQVVFKAGERAEDAHQLLETIKNNKYDRICQIGDQGKEVLAIFLRSR